MNAADHNAELRLRAALMEGFSVDFGREWNGRHVVHPYLPGEIPGSVERVPGAISFSSEEAFWFAKSRVMAELKPDEYA